MAKGWTEERRRAQAERIRKTKPWEKATGPRTAAGKRRSSMNAYKHGGRCRFMDQYRLLLWLNREFVKQTMIAETAHMDSARRTNELLKRRRKPN
jgi:hypothetical protein